MQLRPTQSITDRLLRSSSDIFTNREGEQITVKATYVSTINHWSLTSQQKRYSKISGLCTDSGQCNLDQHNQSLISYSAAAAIYSYFRMMHKSLSMLLMSVQSSTDRLLRSSSEIFTNREGEQITVSATYVLKYQYRVNINNIDRAQYKQWTPKSFQARVQFESD